MQNFGAPRDVMVRLPLKTGPNDRPITSAVQGQQMMTALNIMSPDAKL